MSYKNTWNSGKVPSLAPVTGKHTNQWEQRFYCHSYLFLGHYFVLIWGQHFRYHLVLFHGRLVTATKFKWVQALRFFSSYKSHMSYILNPHVFNFLHHFPVVSMSDDGQWNNKHMINTNLSIYIMLSTFIALNDHSNIFISVSTNCYFPILSGGHISSVTMRKSHQIRDCLGFIFQCQTYSHLVLIHLSIFHTFLNGLGSGYL